jgi:hypothetical protein
MAEPVKISQLPAGTTPGSADLFVSVQNDTTVKVTQGQIKTSLALATVATSGSYNDLSNKPTIPAAQVNSDWNSSSGVSQILNKPTLATVATTGAYSDLSGKPTLGTLSSQNANSVAITGGSINGTTLGASTPSTGAFTTLSASSTVSGTGFSTYLASPPAIGGTAPAAGTFTTLTANSTFQAGKSSANYIQGVGAATTLEPVISVIGSDTNVPLAIRTQGTGAIDLAPGSSGVNISNGGTVTALTTTAAGSAYTSLPTVAITAPTTAGGVQATASPVMFLSTFTITNGGTGYTVGDTLTGVGGTFTTAWSLVVTTVSGGVITGLTTTGGFAGSYTVLPVGAQSTTGGTGSGATVTVNTWAVRSLSITNAGSGYVEQPTVSFSGGGGSGAAAYATVGSGTQVKTLGSTMSFYTPGGEGFRVNDPGATIVNYWQATGASTTNFALLNATGSDTNVSGAFVTKGSGSLIFATNGTSGNGQFRVSHTASAVNYVQVTGSITNQNANSLPNISVQGSDANNYLAIGVKSNAGYVAFFGNNATGNQVFRINSANAANTANRLEVNAAASGSAPSLSVAGGTSSADTNIDLALQAKGTGYVKVNAGTGLGYGTGVGGAVTQATSRTTGVTLNFPCGAITLVSAAGTTSWQTFTVTNSTVAATDTIVVNQKSGTDLYQIFVTNIAAGSFKITFATTGGTSTEQPVFNFAVLKAVAA